MDLPAPMQGMRSLWFWSLAAVVGLLLFSAILSLTPSRTNEIITIAADTATFLGVIALVMGLYQYVRVQQPEARLRKALVDFGEEGNDLKRWFAKHEIVDMGRFAIPRLGELLEPAQTREHALEALIAVIEDEELDTSEQVRAIEVLRRHAGQGNARSALALLQVEVQEEPVLSSRALDALVELLRAKPEMCSKLLAVRLSTRRRMLLVFALAQARTEPAARSLLRLADAESEPAQVRQIAGRLLQDERLQQLAGIEEPPHVASPVSEDVRAALTEFRERLKRGDSSLNVRLSQIEEVLQ